MEVRSICLTHGKELKGLYCRKCSVPVCFTCLEQNHKCHELVGVSTIVEEHRQVVLNELKDDEIWKHMDTLNTNTDHSLQNVTLHHQSLCEEIEREAERQHQEIDKSKNDLLNQVQELQQKHGKPLEDLKLRLKPFSRHSQMNEMILDSLSDQDVVVLSTDLHQIKAVQKEGIGSDTGFQFFSKNNAKYCLGTLVDERHALSDGDDNNELCTKERSENKERSEDKERSEKKCEVKCIKEEEEEEEDFYDCEGLPDVFKYTCLSKERPTNIISITPSSKDSSLVLDTDGKLYQHTNDLNPKMIHNCVYQVKRNSKGLVFLLIGDIGFNKRQEIWQLVPDKRIVRFSGLHRSNINSCIGFSSSGNLVVFSIYSDETDKYYKPGKGSRAAVFSFDNDGKVNFSSFSTESLDWRYAYPRAVILLNNGNSIVSDTSSVKMFQHNKSILWLWNKPVFEKIQEYNGVPGCLRSFENAFQPSDICLDLYGNVIISDIKNNEIHMLDTNLKFLRFIAREKDGLYKPVSLSFDNSRNLWVGCSDNKVYVLNYDTIYHSSK